MCIALNTLAKSTTFVYFAHADPTVSFLNNCLVIIVCIFVDISSILFKTILLDFSLTVKAAPHECEIRTSQP